MRVVAAPATAIDLADSLWQHRRGREGRLVMPGQLCIRLMSGSEACLIKALQGGNE